MRETRSNPRSVSPISDLKALLRASGLRSTTQRVAVLEYFHVHGGQQSHADVYEAFQDRGFDRATVYRILMDLAEVKLLSRTDLGDHIWRFGLIKGVDGVEHTEDHPHFVCTDCGEVACVPGLSVKLEGATKAAKSFAAKKMAVQLKGLCDNCS